MKQQQKSSGSSQPCVLRNVRSQDSKFLNKRQTYTRTSSARSKNSSSCSATKADPYKSLDSLFDLNKPFYLSADNFSFVYPPPCEGKVEDLSNDSFSEFQFEQRRDFVQELKSSYYDNLEPPTCDNNFNFNEDISSTYKDNLEDIEDNLLFEDIEVLKKEVDNKLTGMTDNCNHNESEEFQFCGGCPAVEDDDSIYAPDYPMPHGFGSGVPVDPCQNSDSVMNDLPLSESCVIREMTAANGKAKSNREEIKRLKMIICELQKKSELTEDDATTLKETQTSVVEKISELNEITRKMQRTIGLVDPSSQVFAKMFNMMPYPHECDQTGRPDHSRPTSRNQNTTDGEQSMCNEEILESVRECCEKFAFPQVQHHEDNLPRVIVCGNTEENFPKIVVADSRPRSQGNKCNQMQNFTAQEKLAKEYAQLECGKVLLEQKLAEKDNALDCIERKICGLQAEMRLIVKENCELHEKVACLEKCSPYCPPPCPFPKPTCPPPPCPPPPCPSPPRCPPPPCPPKSPPCPPKTPPCPPPPCPTKTPPCPPRSPARPPPSCPPKTPPCPKPKSPCPPSGHSSRTATTTPKSDCGGFADQSSETYGTPKSFCNQRHGSPRLHGGGSKGCCSSNRQDMQQRSGTGGNCPNASAPPSRGRQCSTEKSVDEQLSNIENQVSMLNEQMINIQRDKKTLELQRKLFENARPSAPQFNCGEKVASGCQSPQKDIGAICEPPAEPNPCVAQQLRDLREQYARLQDDYKSKLCEVSRLRCDSEGLRRELRECKEERERVEIKLIDIQERSRIFECERNELIGSKEQMVEQEQALLVARQRFREAQDELEELRSMIRDQAAQLDDYRNKYLQAQQQVEEQRRQMDLMEMDNARMNENVTLEISRVKNQFQEKLAELAPLSDILKQTQLKLQECQQLRILAEHNREELSRELLGAKDRIDCMQNQISDMQREIQALQDDKAENCMMIEMFEKKIGELRNENERLKNTICRLEEQLTCAQKRVEEKQHEVAQLTAMLEQVREDSARQVARTKERSEAIKRSMQAEISDFEIQLAQCRAAAKTAQKERDEIRQKMQGQICNLNETLQQAQGRIRSLQGHVDYLKVSYSNMFTGPEQGEGAPCAPAQGDAPNAGYDTCDCSK